MPRTLCLWSALALCGLSACAVVDPKPDYDRAARRIESAIGQPVEIALDADAGDIVAELLLDGLTADEAARICLVNNPALRSEFLRIGVSRAEVVQSRLFTNPGLALSLRFPDEGGLADFEVSLSQNIAELWSIRHRTRAAERDLDRAILDVSRRAVTLVAESRLAYVRALRADRLAAIARENLAVAQQLVELAVARRQAGSGTEIDVNLARAERIALEVAARDASVRSVEARANLSKLLGLTSPPDDLPLADPLPESPTFDVTVDRVVEVAREHRLDLLAAESTVRAAEARLAHERSRVWKNVELGVSMERSERRSRGGRDWLAESAFSSLQSGSITPPYPAPREAQSTDYVTGPTLSVELPLFDQNQAQIAIARFELERANLLHEAIERDIVQESRVAHARAQAAVDNARFIHEQLLPLREQGLTFSREAYRVGSATFLAVLEAQRSLLDARARQVDALADAAEAAVAIEQIAGRPLAALAGDRRSPQIRRPEDNP